MRTTFEYIIHVKHQVKGMSSSRADASRTTSLAAMSFGCYKMALTVVSNGFSLPHQGIEYSLKVTAKKITMVEMISPASSPAAVM